ncbi:hypothetical protein HDA32_004586 [Spinactinospora alkalitolerans]|uniref:Uncharacterized protein n=1 Tax=Spinactinospora alkalitolerans TaxID=687207 RepID=A0A852TY55_9ACTN|nr:hypothetical protein [Spinactinospora alkalitolerans]
MRLLSGAGALTAASQVMRWCTEDRGHSLPTPTDLSEQHI